MPRQGATSRQHGSGPAPRPAFEEALARAGLTPTAPTAVLASTTALKIATTSGGAIVISEPAVSSELAAGSLTAVPVIDLDLSRRFRAVWQQPGDDSAPVASSVWCAPIARRA